MERVLLWLRLGVLDGVLVLNMRNRGRDAVVLVGSRVMFGILLLHLRRGLLGVLAVSYILLCRLYGIHRLMHLLRTLGVRVVHIALIDLRVELPFERPQLVDEARVNDSTVRRLERWEDVRGGRLRVPRV